MNNKFWNKKNVLITGHSGFKGMWLSLVLKSFDANVSGLSLEKTNSDIYKSLDSKKYFDNEYFIDLSETSVELNNVFNDNKYDIIFHFGAQALVSIASKNPLDTLKTNIFGTYNLIDKIIDSNTTSSLIVATTDKVYKNSENMNDEEAHLGGKEFYSGSKVAQEMVIEAFKNHDKNKSLNISTIRSGNVLGPGDGAPDRLMTDLIHSLKNKKDIVLRNPHSIRPWQDVFDSISGYLLVAQRNVETSSGDIFNLNSEKNNETTTKEIVEKTIDKWKSDIKILVEESDFYESFKLRINSEKAYNLLGWESKLDIDNILDKIVEWEKNEGAVSLEKVSFNQIDEYFSN